MTIMEVKKHKDRFEINLFHNRKSKSHYTVIVDKDPKKIAQVLIDWYLEGFPVEKAFKIWRQRVKRKDWLEF